MTNAHSARDFFLSFAKGEQHVAKHFAALLTNVQPVSDFGIDVENRF